LVLRVAAGGLGRGLLPGRSALRADFAAVLACGQRRRTYMDASRVASELSEFPAWRVHCVLISGLFMRLEPLALMVVREAGTGLTDGLGAQSSAQFFRLTV
jgi:hypothetical protein